VVSVAIWKNRSYAEIAFHIAFRCYHFVAVRPHFESTCGRATLVQRGTYKNHHALKFSCIILFTKSKSLLLLPPLGTTLQLYVFSKVESSCSHTLDSIIILGKITVRALLLSKLEVNPVLPKFKHLYSLCRSNAGIYTIDAFTNPYKRRLTSCLSNIKELHRSLPIILKGTYQKDQF